MITEKLKNNWRKLISALFILLAFLMPATRNFLAEIFDLTTYAANNNNHNNHNNHNNSSDTKSESQPSVSCPDSHQTVSPMQNSNKGSKNNHSHSKNKKNKPNPK